MCFNVPTLNSIRSTSKHFAIVIENLKREYLHALRVVKAYLLSFLHLMLRYQHLFQHRWFMNSQTHFCGVNAGVFHFLAKKKLSKTFRPKWRTGEKKTRRLYRFFQVLCKKRKVFRNLQERKFGCCWKVCFNKFLFSNFPIRYFESPLYIMTNRSKIWMLTEIESMHCVHAWNKLRPQHMCLQKNSSGTESVQLISNDCVSKDWINHTYLGWMVFATIAW